jgi:hypothetical protein
MTDLLPMPFTGEALSLDAPTADLARALDELKELTSRIREVRERIDEELLRRMDPRFMDRHEGGFKVTAPSPAPKAEWDGAELALALVELGDSTSSTTRQRRRHWKRSCLTSRKRQD